MESNADAPYAHLKVIVDLTTKKATLVNGTSVPTGGTLHIPKTVRVNGDNYDINIIKPLGLKTNLKTLTFDVDSAITLLESAPFVGCTALTSVIFPPSLTTIGFAAFAECTALASVTFPITSNLTMIGLGAFALCTALTSVIFPSSLTTIGNTAFSGCTALASVIFPPSLTTIGNTAFSDCTKLASVTFPITSSLTTIGDSAFSGCTSLDSVTFPTTLTTIGVSAFLRCTALARVTFPPSLTTIGNSAFYYNTGLKSVEFLGGYPTGAQYSADAFYGSGDIESFVTSELTKWPTPDYFKRDDNTFYTLIDKLTRFFNSLKIAKPGTGTCNTLSDYATIKIKEIDNSGDEIGVADIRMSLEKMVSGVWNIKFEPLLYGTAAFNNVYADEYEIERKTRELNVVSTLVYSFSLGESSNIRPLSISYNRFGIIVAGVRSPDISGTLLQILLVKPGVYRLEYDFGCSGSDRAFKAAVISRNNKDTSTYGYGAAHDEFGDDTIPTKYGGGHIITVGSKDNSINDGISSVLTGGNRIVSNPVIGGLYDGRVNLLIGGLWNPGPDKPEEPMHGFIRCFPAGTPVQTPTGDKPIETIQEGDLVTTADGRHVPVKLAHRSLVQNANRSNAPYFIPANSLGPNLPKNDLIMSPNHMLHIGNDQWLPAWKCKYRSSQVRQIRIGETFMYYNLGLPNYFTDNLVVNGVEVESMSTRNLVLDKATNAFRRQQVKN